MAIAVDPPHRTSVQVQIYHIFLSVRYCSPHCYCDHISLLFRDTCVFVSRSGALESGTAPGEERAIRTGCIRLPAMLKAKRRRSQRPSHSRGHQDLRTSTPRSPVRGPGSPAQSCRHVPRGCGQDAWTLSAAGISTGEQ
jgi:hypothetical protein